MPDTSLELLLSLGRWLFVGGLQRYKKSGKIKRIGEDEIHNIGCKQHVIMKIAT